jgi:polyisoprenoid-binding protein YceI
MMRKLVILLFWVSPFMLSAQALKPDNPIQFIIKNAGIAVEGTLSDWDVEVDFDPKKLSKSTINGAANPASIQTGIKLRDRHLQGREYFHVEKFPEITLTSKRFEVNGKNSFLGIFELKIRDVKKDVEIVFVISSVGRQPKFKGEFTMDRLDFGIGEKSLVLSDDVKVLIEF